MVKSFNKKCKLCKSGHKYSYAIYPNKLLIESMNWKEGDILDVIPIPEKGIICLKGKKTTKAKFMTKFKKEYLDSYLKLPKTLLRKVNTMIKKFDMLEIAGYNKEYINLLRIKDDLERVVAINDKKISERRKITDEFVRRYKRQKIWDYPIIIGSKFIEFKEKSNLNKERLKERLKTLEEVRKRENKRIDIEIENTKKRLKKYK